MRKTSTADCNSLCLHNPPFLLCLGERPSCPGGGGRALRGPPRGCRGGCSLRGAGGGQARDVGSGCWTPYLPPSLLPPAGQPTPQGVEVVTTACPSVVICTNVCSCSTRLHTSLTPHPRLFQLLLLKMVSHSRATFRILQVFFGKQHGCRRLAGWVIPWGG